MPEVDVKQWNEFVGRFPDAHVLQSAPWGELKSHFGWQPVRVVSGDAGVQILFRALPLGLTLAYIPKGPLGENWDSIWPEVEAICRARKAVFLKVEPDAWEEQDFAERLGQRGFRPSPHSIQPRRTITIDIRGEEDTILGRMKQKTRYNIRLAAKKDVLVKPSADIQAFSQMMDVTGQRDGFGVHTQAYYQRAYQLFHPVGACELLLAEYAGQPLAGLIAFAQGKRAWYFYGASTNQERNRMPTYLLQWEAMRWAREKGCTEYDLWGAPDEEQDKLEAEFMGRSEGLWGVYRFKRGFGGELRRSASAWDKVFNPLLYTAYQVLIARRGLG